MLNMYPDSTLIPRARQKLRDVQEVLAERETQIGLYYQSRENYSAAIARLQTVVDTYPLYSKSDLAMLTIGDAYAGQAKIVQNASGVPGAIKERMQAFYTDKAAKAYAKVITRYPAAPRVEDARDRLVAMNRPVPTPSSAAYAENQAEEESRQKLQFNDKLLGLVKHAPTVVEAVHVGDPSLEDPSRTLAPDVTRENVALYNAAVAAGRPAAPAPTVVPTSPSEPPRSDQPSLVPLQMQAPGATGVGVTIVSEPNSGPPAAGSTPAADPNALVKPVGNENTAIPAPQPPAPAPDQINDIKTPPAPASADDGKKKKAPKVDQSDESSSKKKKKRGLAKLNPF
jgi:outer membrane protein assembly factor BamD